MESGNKTREILLKYVGESCYWEDMDNLCNTPVPYVLTAMEEYASQQCASLKEENERLKEDYARACHKLSDAMVRMGEFQSENTRLLERVKELEEKCKTYYHYRGTPPKE
jgi:hypothetical protein